MLTKNKAMSWLWQRAIAKNDQMEEAQPPKYFELPQDYFPSLQTVKQTVILVFYPCEVTKKINCLNQQHSRYHGRQTFHSPNPYLWSNPLSSSKSPSFLPILQMPHHFHPLPTSPQFISLSIISHYLPVCSHPSIFIQIK